LWIPHNSWDEGRHQRDQYFLDVLKNHHRVAALSWCDYLPHSIGNLLNPLTYLRALNPSKSRISGFTVYNIPRLPNLPGVLGRFSKSLNQIFFNISLKRIIKAESSEIVVSASQGQNIGIPGSNLGIPIVFDYVDWCERAADQEEVSLKSAQAVLCVSSALQQRAQKWNSRCHRLPNGVDIDRIQSGSGSDVRSRYHLEDSVVISLIGLTFSENMYFVESIRLAQKSVPNLKCLLVGKSDRLRKEIPACDDTFIHVGPVEYAQIKNYFAATDIGLYPGDNSEFFQSASPIKIFEYTAAEKKVVSSNLREFNPQDWPNIHFTEPNARSFAESIVKAAKEEEKHTINRRFIASHDWNVLGKQLEHILEDTLFNWRATRDL